MKLKPLLIAGLAFAAIAGFSQIQDPAPLPADGRIAKLEGKITSLESEVDALRMRVTALEEGKPKLKQLAGPSR